MYFPWDKYFKKNKNNEDLFYNSLRLVIQNKIKSKTKSQEQNHLNESSPSNFPLKSHQMTV